MERLASIKALPNQQSYNVAKIHKLLQAEGEIIQGLFDKLVEEYAEKVDGVPVQVPGSSDVKLAPKTQLEFHAKLRDLHRQVIKIDRPLLELRHFQKDLYPKDVAALMPLWAEVDEGALK